MSGLDKQFSLQQPRNPEQRFEDLLAYGEKLIGGFDDGKVSFQKDQSLGRHPHSDVGYQDTPVPNLIAQIRHQLKVGRELQQKMRVMQHGAMRAQVVEHQEDLYAMLVGLDSRIVDSSSSIN